MQWSKIEILIDKKASLQRAVWRKRGRGSSDAMCRTATSALVQAFVIPPPAPSRWDVVCKLTGWRTVLNSLDNSAS